MQKIELLKEKRKQGGSRKEKNRKEKKSGEEAGET